MFFKNRQSKESNGFKIEHVSLIEEGKVSSLMIPQDTGMDTHTLKKIPVIQTCGSVEKDVLTAGGGASTVVTLIMGFWRLGWWGKELQT